MMTPDPLAIELENAGFAPDDAASRAALVRLATSRLAQQSTRQPFGAWFVPGRVEVFGKHTDYAGGRSLVAALPRGMAIAAASRDDGRVRVVDVRDDREVTVDPADQSLRFAGWTTYVSTVVRRLASNFPSATFGADIAFVSDLPRAAGMSSSSVLIVGIGLALIARGGLETRSEWRASICDELDLAGFFGAVENGSSFGALGGAGGVGTQGGSEDHTAILTCRAGHVSMYRYVPVTRLADAAIAQEWRFILMTSGIHAGKTGAARGSYNRAAQMAAVLRDMWREESGDTSGTSLRAAIDSQSNAAERLRERAQRGQAGFTGADLARRLAHFIAEDGRVPLAVDAFGRADKPALGELSAASQASAEVELGNQVNETIVLSRLARENGAFAASSFGAGFGGSVWALVDGSISACEAIADRWRNAYLSACPDVRDVRWFVARPGPAAMRLAHWA